jgi:hypothetical protein
MEGDINRTNADNRTRDNQLSSYVSKRKHAKVAQFLRESMTGPTKSK